MRESFVFYKSFFDAICDLNDKKRLKMFDAITNLALKNEENIKLSKDLERLFILIKPQILANNKRYEDGCKGGRPKKNKTSGFSEKKPNENVNVNDNEKENVNVNENVVSINKPTKEKIEEYCNIVAKRINIDDFYNYYSASDWLDKNGLPINWKQKVLSWSKKCDYKEVTEVRYEPYNPYK